MRSTRRHGGSDVSRLQTGLLSTALVAVLGSLLYPPHAVTLPGGVVKRLGYGWIFSPPRYGLLEGSVEAGLLAVQILGIVVLTGLAYLIAGNIASYKGPRSKWTDRPWLVAQMQAYAAKAREPGAIAAIIAGGVLAGGVAKELGPSLLRFVVPESSESLNRPLNESDLGRMARSLTSRLPMVIDEVTRWDAVNVGPGLQFNYVYTLTSNSGSVRSQLALESMLSHALMTRVCSKTETRNLIDRGVTLSYRYRDAKGTSIGLIDVASHHCDRLGHVTATWHCLIMNRKKKANHRDAVTLTFKRDGNFDWRGLPLDLEGTWYVDNREASSFRLLPNLSDSASSLDRAIVVKGFFKSKDGDKSKGGFVVAFDDELNLPLDCKREGFQ